MAISLGGFSGGGGGASTDTLDDVTGRGATTTNAITVGGVTVGTEYSLPALDGSANQVLQTNGTGTVSFATLDFTGGLEYKGAFNATAGTPSLANAEKGDFYIIDTAGTIYGQTWAVGDHLLINEDMGGLITNSQIDKIDNTQAVTSVNGQTGPVNLGAGDLSDVTITSAASGEVLKYNGTNWIDANVDYTELTNTPTNVSAFTNDANYVASGDNVSVLTNDANYVASGDNVSVLTNDANYVASGDNVSVLTNDAGYLTGITGESIGDLSDVTVTSAANGEVLSYNGTNWVNSAASAGSLSGLSDTTIGTPTNSEVLKYNGVAWVDANVDYTEITNTPTNVSTFTNDANYVASGDNVSTLTNDAGYLTSIPTASHSTAGILETATNAEATNATANDKILTPANLSHIDLSTFDNDSGFISDITSENLGDLSDVTVTSAASGEVLKYNGSAWVDAQLAYSELSGTPTNVSTFTNDSGYITDITGESIGDLSDVTVTSAANGEVLSYNGTNWVNSAASAGSLSGLSDTTISSPASGEVLSYNGTNWVNDTITSSEYTVVNKTSANFNASDGFFYYVNTVSGTTTVVSLPARTYALATEKIKFFNHGTGTLRVQETYGTGAIHPDESGNDPSGSGTSYKEIASRCIIEFLGIQNTFVWEWAISAQLELGKDTLSNDGDVLRYDSSTDQMTALPYTFPTSDGSANQILITDGNGALSFTDQTSGGGGYTYSAITADPANAQYDYHYSCTGTFTVTLPASAGADAGKEIRIKNMGTGTITVDGNSTETIDGQTTIDLDTQYSSITLIATGNTPAAWEIV